MRIRLRILMSGWAALLACFGLLLANSSRLNAAPTASGSFEGWYNISRAWGGTLTEKNARLTEGDTVSLRYYASLPAGSVNTVYLKYDFTTGDGTSRFFDYLGAQNVSDATLLSGLSVTGAGTDARLPDDPGVPGDQSLGKLRVFNATITGFGPYTLVNGVKMLPVNFAVASGGTTKVVVIGYGAHLARSQDSPSGSGASTYPGASRKAYAKLNSGSDANVSVNPAAIIPSADIELTQVATPSPVSVGAPLTFTITVKNLSSISASSVVLSDTPPTGAVITSSQGTVTGNTVSLGTLAAGQSATVRVVVTAPCAAVANSATVTSTTPDPVSANNSVTTSVVPKDTTPPTLTLTPPANAPANGTCQAAVPVVAYTSADNCSTVTVAQSPTAGTLVGLGPNTITVTATDAAGNITTKTTTFTVVDIIPPSLTLTPLANAPADGTCRAAVPVVAYTSADNCSAVTVTQSPKAGTLVGLGPNTITVTATDAAGNITTKTTTFTVVDTTPPSLTLTPPANAPADGTCQAPVPAIVYTSADNCSAVTVAQSPKAGTLVGLGPNTITVTATDAAGNLTTKTTTFTVVDTTPPSLTLTPPANAPADGTCQAPVPAIAFTSADNCSGVTVAQSPTAGTLVGLGPNTITVTATDAAGNITAKTTTLTVVDTTPPTIACPADITVGSNAGCTYIGSIGSATASDNCDPNVRVSNNAPSAFPPGATVVTWTARDRAGLITTCTQTVTVVDTTPPSITPPADVTLSSNTGCTYVGSIGTATAADNCDANVQVANDAPPSFPLGVTVVTWTARDKAGLTTTATQRVTVVDKTPPTFAGLPSTPIITFAAPTRCGASVDLTGVSAVDNCSATAEGTRSDGQPLTAEYPLGTTRVTFTATDASGNVASAKLDVVVLPLNLAWPVATRLLLPDPDPNTGLSRVNIEECIGLESQSRWYKFKVQPGSKLLVTLENLPENYDIVLYKDIQEAYDQLTQTQSTADLTQLNAEFAADAFSADAFSSEAFAGAAFSGAAFSTEEFAGAAWSGAAFSAAAFSGAAWSPDVYAPDTFFGAAFSGAAFSGAAWSGAAWSADAVAGAAFSGAAWSGAAWSGAAWSGAAWSGAAFSGAAWSTEAASGAAWSGAAFSGAAFSDAQLRSIVGVSAFPGIGNEVILANTWDNAHDFYVRVRGRNGAFAPGRNYKLGVQMLNGPCRDVRPLDELPPSNLPMPSSGGIKTLVVADFGRMAQLSGTAADVDTLRTRLAAFAGRPEVSGWVMDVGLDARVAAAQAQADASTSCVSGKNIVARAIRDLILNCRGAHPEIEYIVLVGNDAVIPFFRQPDQGLLANENNYVPPVLSTSASEAALKLGYYLTQDPYAAACDLSLKVGNLPLPDVAIGRLVETPAEVTTVLDAYDTTTGGTVATPTTALVTGYDFLADAAQAIQLEFESGIGQAVETLIQPGGQLPQDGWTASDLRARMLGSRHDVMFLGGHFSAAGALAADYLTRMTAAELDAAAVDLKNSIVISIGCHSGYNIAGSDGVPSVTPEPDWAQAFARKGASLIAGTGYQYGDTDIIEYSERLYLNLAREMRAGSGAVPVGKALVKAKALYLAETPLMRGLHEKALLQATLFGLPMLAIDMPAGRGPLPSDTSVVTALTPAPQPGQTFNLQSADLSVQPTLTKYTSELKDVDATASTTVTSTYFAAGNGIVANPSEPLFPLEVRNVTVRGQVLRGVGFRGGTYTDEEDLRPLTSAATTELSGVHTPFLTEILFPIRFWNVNYFDALCTRSGTADEATRLFILPAQFVSKEPGSPLGTFRKFTGMDFRLYYNANTTTYAVTGGNSLPSVTPALSAPPSIASVTDSIAADGQSVRIRVRVVGNPFAGVQEVWVTYTGVKGTPGYYGQWQSLTLTQPDPENDSSLWEGTLTTGSVSPDSLRYIVQAVNGVGLVTLDTRLGAYYIPGDAQVLPTEASTLQIQTPVPAQAAYSTKVSFKATLLANGAPVSGRIVNFALGTQEARASTDVNGVATVEFPVLGFPDSYDLRASFVGDAIYKPSADAIPFSIVRQVTALGLAPTGTIYVQAGTQTAFVATLTADGKPLAERTVFFVFRPYVLDANGNPVLDGNGNPTFASTYYNFPVITDFAGRAAFASLPRNAVPDGTYDFSVYFGSGIPGQPINATDLRYLASTTAGKLEFRTTTVVVNDPQAAIHFPTDSNLTTSSDGSGDCTARFTMVTTAASSIATSLDVVYSINGAVIQNPYPFPVGTTTVKATALVGNAPATSGTFNVTVVDDEAPTIQCPPNLTVASNVGCTYVGGIGSPATADNCTGPLDIRNDAPAAFPLGTTRVTWTVRDQSGLASTCVQMVTVVDSAPPTAVCRTATVRIDPVTLLLTLPAVEIDGGSVDNCGVRTLEIGKGVLAAGSTLFADKVTFSAAESANGTQWVTLRVTDTSGNRSVCSTQVTLPDINPPQGNVIPTPSTLGTPNHKLVPIQLAVSVNESAASQMRYRITCVRSSEPLNGTGDGDRSPDWIFDSGPNSVITETTTPSYSISECVAAPSYGWSAPGNNLLSLQLRAERAQNGNGRVYTITVEIMDPAGNVGSTTCQVLAPK